MWRWGLRIAATLIAAPLLYGLAGFAGAIIPGPYAQIPGEKTERIGLARGPIHYDFLLPLSPEIRQAFGFAEVQGLPIADARAEWLVVGWGAESFYTSVGTYSDVTAQAVWRGVTGDASVMHLDVVGPITDFPGLTWVGVSHAQMAALTDAVLDSFAKDDLGKPIAFPAEGFDDTDAFYSARGEFHIGNTCNVWIGKMLRASGVPFGIWTPTPQAVSVSLIWFDE